MNVNWWLWKANGRNLPPDEKIYEDTARAKFHSIYLEFALGELRRG